MKYLTYIHTQIGDLYEVLSANIVIDIILHNLDYKSNPPYVVFQGFPSATIVRYKNYD